MSDVAPETGPDGRPRPRYGEYATPEEQRARIQQPDATFSLDAGEAPASAPETRAQPGLFGPPPSGAPQFGAPARAAGTPHPVDRIVTIALLAYGAINVIFSAVSFFDLSALATQALQLLGVDAEFTNVDAARVWGPIAAGVLVVGYLLTAVLSIRRLRTGRWTWWVPLVGAAATYIVVYICISVPLLGDPAFTRYVSGS